MATNVEVEKTGMENNLAILRRFTKRVQGSGVLPRVRSLRYKNRNLSSYKVKVKTLSRIARKAEIELLIKLGKYTPPEKRRR